MPAPPDWGKSIVQGKTYFTTNDIGNDLWIRLSALIQEYLLPMPIPKPGDSLVSGIGSPQYGNPILTKVRLGQGAFRVLVTDAYQRRCSITGEKTFASTVTKGYKIVRHRQRLHGTRVCGSWSFVKDTNHGGGAVME